MINPFRKTTKKDSPINQRLEEISLVGKLARTCLDNPDFKEYRRKYEELKQAIIDTMLEYQEPDPLKYAIEMRILTAQLKQLNKMIPDIERDAEIK